MGRNKRRDASNPVVFLDVATDGAPVGRILLELFKADVPRVGSPPLPASAGSDTCRA